MAVKIQIRRDNSAVWRELDPVLDEGEQGLELDTGRTKFGDGVTPWNERPYAYGTSPEEGSKTLWGDIEGTLAAQTDLKTILDSKLGSAEKGVVNGVAPLDGDGLVPQPHIPNLFPKGGIIMWSGTISNIPAGWALCDGTNGTPNLIGKFIRGVGTKTTNPGTTGGSDSLALSTANLPVHRHVIGSHSHAIPSHSHSVSGSTSTAGNHYHNPYSAEHFWLVTTSDGRRINVTNSGTYYSMAGLTAAGANTASFTSYAGDHAHTFSGTTGTATLTTSGADATCSDTGSGTAFDNRPAYYELAYIMKL